MTTYIKTNEKIEVLNYPYGFTLKTTLFDYVEFHPKKGFRHCTQTINPKSGRLNNPKKSTYYKLIVRFYNEVGHIKYYAFDFNGDKELNKVCNFVAKNFDLFTSEEIDYIYRECLFMAKVDMQATAMYGGAKIEDLTPLYVSFVTLAVNGLKTKENHFASMFLDTEKIEATKPENYNPFTIRTMQYL